jgi:hypothetical protein
MSIWTLWVVLYMTSGEVDVMEARSFTTEQNCAQVANYIRNNEQEGVRKAIPVCKKSTTV